MGEIEWGQLGPVVGVLLGTIGVMAVYIRKVWKERIDGYKRVVDAKDKLLAAKEDRIDELTERLITEGRPN